jgi:hypothetical protein
LDTLTLSLAISALSISVPTLILCVLATAEVKGLKRSTHQVTFIDPTKQIFENITKETSEQLTKDKFDNL